jgi:mannose-1-phosphate guanylyltransferase
VVVVAEEREELALEQLRGRGAIDVVAQPANLGTGPGLLLPLCRTVVRDPEAVVAVFPSDHYVRDTEAFVESVREAEAVAREEDCVVLLAAEPEGPEPGYGWIRWIESGGRRIVTRFVEKPDAAAADALYRGGALWNTFIMVGPARRFWELGEEFLPRQTSLLGAYGWVVGSAAEWEVLSYLYTRMPAADFSHEVLQKSRALRVVPIVACGWSDWGTPARVLASLKGTRDHDRLLEKLERASAASRLLSEMRAAPAA